MAGDRHYWREPSWNGLMRSRSVIAMLAIAGLLFTGLLSGWLWYIEQQQAEDKVRTDIEKRAQQLRNELHQGAESLYALRDVIHYVDSLPEIVFADVAGAALQRHPLVEGLVWLPRVRAAERQDYERRNGPILLGQTQTAAPVRDEYFPIRYVVPKQKNLYSIGVDVGAHPVLSQALDQARRAGALGMSGGAARLAPGSDGQGVIIALPVFKGQPTTVSEQQQALRGFVVAVVDISRLLGGVFPDLPHAGWCLLEDISNANHNTLFSLGTPEGLRASSAVPVFAGREWLLSMAVPQSTVLHGALPTTTAIFGTLLVLLVCGYLYLLQRRGELVQSLVDQRTRELRQANQRLASLSVTDPLTGLANRRAFDEYLAQEWQRALRYQQPLSLLMLDLDYFKQLNDRHGHPAGDRCLVELADRLRSKFRRAGDLIARIGGEEFVVVMPGADASVQQRAEQFRACVSATPFRLAEELAVTITISGGLASRIPQPDQLPQMLVKAADDALYQAKRAGRNCIQRDG